MTKKEFPKYSKQLLFLIKPITKGFPTINLIHLDAGIKNENLGLLTLIMDTVTRYSSNFEMRHRFQQRQLGEKTDEQILAFKRQYHSPNNTITTHPHLLVG